MMIPNPVSPQELTKLYDSTVNQINGKQDSPLEPSEYENLQLLCKILVSYDDVSVALSVHQRRELETTIKTLDSIQELLSHEITRSEIQITVHNGEIVWRQQEAQVNLLEFDRDDLAAEEETLMDMAETPIP